MYRPSFIIGGIVAVATYSLLHYLVYARVANGLELSAPRRLGLKIGLVLAALSFLLALFCGHTSWGTPLLYVGATWFGLLAIAVTVLPVAWILSLWRPERMRPITILALVVVMALAVYSLVNGSRRPVITDIRVSLEKLPARLSGFTVVQLSDLHLGQPAPSERLSWIVEQVNGMSPDLVVITGDLIDRNIRRDSDSCQWLGGIKARYGVVAVAGNHDYYAGYDTFLQVADVSGIAVLRNERRLIAGAIQLVGIDEPAGRSYAEGGPDLDKALAGSDPSLPVILLSHRPDTFDRAARRQVDLQLSGHAHAGQIPPIDLLVWLIYPYSFGHYEKGASRIYTTSGTGTWGPPMRLFSRNEIVRITLVRE